MPDPVDAGYELIAAMLAALRAATAVTGIVGEKIFARPPDDPPGYPYISVGPSTSIPDDFDCLDGEEITIQLDCWSSGEGEAFSDAQCRKLSGAVKRALHDAELELTVNALVVLRCELVRVFSEPTPNIHHGAVQFTATVELSS